MAIISLDRAQEIIKHLPTNSYAVIGKIELAEQVVMLKAPEAKTLFIPVS